MAKQKKLTRAQLMRACRLQDAANRRKEQAEVKRLARAMTSPGFSFYPWQMEEVKRLVHEAYGRARLHRAA